MKVPISTQGIIVGKFGKRKTAVLAFFLDFAFFLMVLLSWLLLVLLLVSPHQGHCVGARMWQSGGRTGTDWKK